ncbi:MAG: molybdopterin-dependent oxidoreductase, partial [Candidatus Eremiobacteraeota bacterium]|nr:molybdopterin-dependent oxidoreductase [Candidatus Eremiobacteraeota bacterium]
MPGLGTSFGRGGATTFLMDLKNADCILIEGSNFAECHPVGFRFVMEAKRRGAKIIHVDPRFTRTSALADLYAPIRSGTDIVFLGAVINWILRNERYFRDYVLAYTDAANIVRDDFMDTEDLDGLFSGWRGGGDNGTGGVPQDSTTRMAQQGAGRSRGGGDPAGYDTASWFYEREHSATDDAADNSDGIKRDQSLKHPRCVLNVLKRHFSRYTPDMVEDICGMPRDSFFEICHALADNSGRERTTAFAYAVGWTQHTVGVQLIRSASILQLLLGNIGRPGGGIMALRGHANIQGATDIATLYDLLPGYLPLPSVEHDEQTLEAYLKLNTKPTGGWSDFPKYIVSLLKAWYGDAATMDNDFGYEYLPQLTGDHSTLPTQVAMKDGLVKGYFVIGQNPAASGLNAEQARAALGNLEWMVNVDSYETETASFWKRPGADPSTIGTECFFIPAATILEKDGTLTNTNRMLQWHDKAVEPAGQSRSDLWFVHQLGLRLKSLYAGSTDVKDRPLLALTWDYEHEDASERMRGEPSALKVLQEINGYFTRQTAPGHAREASCDQPRANKQVASFADLQADGSTACGAWIYTGVCPDEHTNRARNRQGDDRTALGWGFAWPANRRMLYNRASADPDGKPWSERKKYIWWDAAAPNHDGAAGRWVGADVPDFPPTKPPGTPAVARARGLDAHSGAEPFIMQPDGRAKLFVGAGLKDGPLPTHYEPVDSVMPNLLYKQQHNPV